MIEWMTADIRAQIKKICEFISNDDFETIQKEDFVEVGEAEDVKRAILEYLCGDILDEKELPRVQVPNNTYILENSRTNDATKKLKEGGYHRLELDLIIDNKQSDMTVIYHIRPEKTSFKVRIYDVLVM